MFALQKRPHLCPKHFINIVGLDYGLSGTSIISRDIDTDFYERIEALLFIDIDFYLEVSKSSFFVGRAVGVGVSQYFGAGIQISNNEFNFGVNGFRGASQNWAQYAVQCPLDMTFRPGSHKNKTIKSVFHGAITRQSAISRAEIM
jgi:hypothetical protein